VTSLSLINPDVLVIAAKGMQEVKCCTNKPLVCNCGCQLSKVVLQNGCKTVVVINQ